MSETSYTLQQRQAYPLDVKIALSEYLIRQWYAAWGGRVYVAFSGGKDSTVLLHLVRRHYPDVPAVYLDTTMAFPEERRFVQTWANVQVQRGRMTFADVIRQYGYPVISKEVSAAIAAYRKKSVPDRLLAIPECWQGACAAPFAISDHCCEVLKVSPAHEYEHQSGRMAYIGLLAEESNTRQKEILRRGCNVFEAARPVSRPLAHWREEDVWQYLEMWQVPYSPLYDLGWRRTGCVFCGFGVQSEGQPNRMQRLKSTHPKLWEYGVTQLGLREVYAFMGWPIEM